MQEQLPWYARTALADLFADSVRSYRSFFSPKLILPSLPCRRFEIFSRCRQNSITARMLIAMMTAGSGLSRYNTSGASAIAVSAAGEEYLNAPARSGQMAERINPACQGER